MPDSIVQIHTYIYVYLHMVWIGLAWPDLVSLGLAWLGFHHNFQKWGFSYYFSILRVCECLQLLSCTTTALMTLTIIDRDTKLYLYKSEAEPCPDGTFSLTGCILRDEGTKLGRKNRKTIDRDVYHVFGLYLAGGDGRGPNSGVLLRMSSKDENVCCGVIFLLIHFNGLLLDFLR